MLKIISLLIVLHSTRNNNILVCVCVYIYIYIYGEMVDFGESDKSIRISGKVD